jgi:predicted hotdog family 3-hydroxylacyl-ACP dehydratase
VLNRDLQWIAARIPHSGNMCLLEAVTFWSDQEITCRSGTHRSADHPLRDSGGLGIVCGIEYAAQAMAVHGALLAGDNAAPPPAGFLTSVREVRWNTRYLNDVPGDLIVHAQRISGNDLAILYSFSVQADGTELLGGRASVMLKAGAR